MEMCIRDRMKDGAMTYRANLNMSGGGSTARYFVSLSYINEEGMYKTARVGQHPEQCFRPQHRPVGRDRTRYLGTPSQRSTDSEICIKVP